MCRSQRVLVWQVECLGVVDERARKEGRAWVYMGGRVAGRRRRQAEAVTVMAMTLVQGWPLHQ
jgi:phage terminase large subunit-like protein